MLNAEKYKDEIQKILDSKSRIALNRKTNKLVRCGQVRCYNCAFYEKCTIKSVQWLISEYKKPILDDVEKKYLSEVIKPFRNRVMHIKKIRIRFFDCEEISITYYSTYKGNKLIFTDSLPNFSEGTMYKNMELGREYTLEELGL